MWPIPMNIKRNLLPPYQSRMSLPAKGAVILLGAGASATVGAPLMRGFIDLAQDYNQLNMFDKDVLPDIEATLNLYKKLKSRLLITEEDIENVENLLSIAELVNHILDIKIGEEIPLEIAGSVSRFVEAVLVKAIRMPSPASPQWIGLNNASSYKQVVAALAYYKEKITVITLNYDCALEYACYCMGVPFTYNRAYGKGAEILKLHGSINWLFCQKESCVSYNKVFIGTLKHTVLSGEDDTGTVEVEQKKCLECSAPLRPLIVPPTWGKALEQEMLKDAWKQAFKVLSDAETLVSIGYSLPDADPKVRELLHIGLTSANLRQAMVVVGNDDKTSNRWTRFFRESWKEYRLAVRMQNFEELGRENLFSALAIDNSTFPDSFLHMPPFSKSLNLDAEEKNKLVNELKKRGLWNERTGRSNLDLAEVAKQMRTDYNFGDSGNDKLLVKLGFDWRPSGSIFPTHGEVLGVEVRE